MQVFFGEHGLSGRMVEDVWEIGVRVKGRVLSKGGFLCHIYLSILMTNYICMYFSDKLYMHLLKTYNVLFPSILWICSSAFAFC